jgi:hypothetical protein
MNLLGTSLNPYPEYFTNFNRDTLNKFKWKWENEKIKSNSSFVNEEFKNLSE